MQTATMTFEQCMHRSNCYMYLPCMYFDFSRLIHALSFDFPTPFSAHISIPMSFREEFIFFFFLFCFFSFKQLASLIAKSVFKLYTNKRQWTPHKKPTNKGSDHHHDCLPREASSVKGKQVRPT